MPVIGFLTSLGRNERPNLRDAFRRGLSESGYVEGRNVAIEYRFAEDQHDRVAGAGRRSGRPQGRGDRSDGRRQSGFCCQGIDYDDSDRVHVRWRPGSGRLRRQPQSSRRQRHRGQLSSMPCSAPRRSDCCMSSFPMLLSSRSGQPDKSGKCAHSNATRRRRREPSVGSARSQCQQPSEIDAAFATLRQRRASALLVSSRSVLYSPAPTNRGTGGA